MPPRLPFRDRGRFAPDESGAGFPQSLNQSLEVLLVGVQTRRQCPAFLISLTGDLGVRMSIAQIPKSPIEMNEVPISRLQPLFNLLNPSPRMLGVSRVVNDLSSTFQD